MLERGLILKGMAGQLTERDRRKFVEHLEIADIHLQRSTLDISEKQRIGRLLLEIMQIMKDGYLENDYLRSD